MKIRNDWKSIPKEVNDMTIKQKVGNRITSVLLTIAILLSIIPITIMTTSAVSLNSSREADPSTMDGWEQIFPTTDEISTENAGGVWMDKSVFTDSSAFAGLGITQDEQDSFLVALSAMAANMSVTGMSNVPTDTILVLDVSGSMNDNADNNDVAEELVEAANDSIAELQSTNKYNRVGVVLYSGPTTRGGAASAGDAVLILPLGRYTTTNNKFLVYDVNSNNDRDDNYTTERVGINSNVRIEGTSTRPASASKTVVGGTYIQKGVILAMNQFIANSNSVTVEDPAMGTLRRKPILVLMSDGAPTVGSTNFTNPTSIQLGDGTYTDASLGFVSQLSAAYAKAKIEEKYETDALFYTLGLGLGNDGVAIGVLDPSNANASTALDDFWNDSRTGWFQDGFRGYNLVNVGQTVSLGGNRSVTKISTPLEQNYVDRYFSAESERLPNGSVITLQDKLKQAFADIVNTIQLQSAYFPTLVSRSEDLSGYISFVDKIGEYMSVTDIKGILIDDHLFSGADLSRNFVAGGGALGTYDNPTALGMEMVAAVRARLGIDSDDTARTLIGLAYENGQLSYTNADNYSNYIGWYANAVGEFLGFYNEGTTVLPAATGNTAADPAFVVRSYGYLGAVDESHGVSESDMMYATVQVRKNIATGEELVTFAVPAALIPVVSYNVTLDENGALSDLTVKGADKPIRLVYEVALDEHINAFNVKDVVSEEYLSDPHNVNEDGSVNFYTNMWDHKNTTGYGTVNTYSYFNPSRQNEKYYYLEDAPVYNDNRGTLYRGDAQPSDNDTMYRTYKVYKNNGSLRTETVYRPLSAAEKATALRKDDGTWYIPKGNVHVNLDGYTVDKTENTTETLSQSYIPFVDTHNHSINDEGYNFYVGATLGNNGKITVFPETGIKLTKTMAKDAAKTDEVFEFDIFNETKAGDGSPYPAWLIKADGTETETSVLFDDGNATVELAAGDVIYIGGLEDGTVLRIVERETVEYVASSVGLSERGTVTVEANTLKTVEFINDNRGEGNLTIAKEVKHSFGTDYPIPADKVFTMQVTLDGIGTANAAFKAEHTNGSYTEITTDENGRFTVQLKHDEQFEVFGLPAGTEATVVEQDPAAGFTPAYWDNGQIGDGTVTVATDSTVSVVVVNDYEADEVYPVNINLSGTKYVWNPEGKSVEWTDDYRFEIVLERYGANGWENVDTKILSKDQQTFTFDMSKEIYDAPGVYSYQIYEVEPEINDADRVDGMIYDLVWHTFSVYVSDTDMDGQLEIARVHSEHANKDFELVNGVFNVTVDFNNTQTVTVPALATVEIQKVLYNDSESTLVSPAGYNFGLYADAACMVAATVGNGISAISLNPTDAVGEGWIDIQIDEIGTYTFYVKEIAGDVNNMTYSEQVIKIVVEVTAHETANNALVAELSYFTSDGNVYDLGNDGEVEFINTYDPDDAELTIDFVRKELSGRDLIADEFSFEVQTQEGATVLEGTNNSAGEVTFDGVLAFDKVGTYFYNIVETSDDGNGVVTDKTTYRITVTVTDVNGQLSASYVLVNAIGDTVTFKNTYTANPVSHYIVGNKVLNGRTLLNDEFAFVLTEVSFDGKAIQDPRSWMVKNQATDTDNIVFPTISYDKAGTYVYTVNEVISEDATTYGISYDTGIYTVTIVIEDNGAGALTVKSESVSGAGTALKFENNYRANPTSAQFTAEKQLTGKVDNNLVGGEYEFELYNSNANWEKVSLKETVENTAGGLIAFTKIDFNAAEDQYFVVVEKNGGQTIDGVTYDDSEYLVWVKVTDDLKGQLHAAVHIYDGEGIPQDKIRFVNVYEVTGGANVTLSGEKIISGRDFIDGDSFSFELYEADENYNIGESSVATAVMDTNTRNYEFSIDFTAGDAGKTFYYVVKETDAGKTLNGLTYSNAEYQIKIEVRDNGVGGIETVTTVVNATTSTLNFVNEYAVEEGVTVQFDGTKSLENKELDELKFSFNLIESDANRTVGNILQSKQNDGAVIAFDVISYMAAGDYYYLITEENAGETVDRITYDDTIYHIHVKVTDNLDGTLSKAVTMTKIKGELSENADAVAFTNIYTPNPADITVDIDIFKTVVNKGTDTITPEGFEFLLKDMSDGSDGITVRSDADGKAKFTLTFTEEDIGKEFNYKLTEVDGGMENVTYSTAEYAIVIDVALDEETNTIVATMTLNGEEVAAPVAEFENIYDYTPKTPQTGDDSNLGIWIVMMIISGGAALTLCAQGKKKRRIANN